MKVYQINRPGTVGYTLFDLDDVDLLGERDTWLWHKQNWQAGAMDGAADGEYIDYCLAEVETEIARRQRFGLTRPDGARRYSREFLDALRASTDLVTVIQGHGGNLRQVSAGHWRGSCPWCEGGRRDTLSVLPDRSFWHCFRCGLKGDHIKWHQLMGRLSFVQAVEGLAAVVGVEVPEPPRIGPRRLIAAREAAVL